MNSTQISIDLHDGWWCLFDCKRTLSGRYSGVAEIIYDKKVTGTIVVMGLRSLEDAIARAKLRGRQFCRTRTNG